MLKKKKSPQDLVKKKKSSRYRYFSIQIYLGIEGAQSHKLFQSSSGILQAFELTEFVSQKFLESKLNTLTISEGTRKIYLLRFTGQLECPSLGNPPYWNISCHTSSPTTAPSVARALSNALFPPEVEKLEIVMDPRIKVEKREEFEKLKKEFLININLKDSIWFPGHFNQQISNFFDLIENSDIFDDKSKLLNLISIRPEVKKILISLGKALEEGELTKG